MAELFEVAKLLPDTRVIGIEEVAVANPPPFIIMLLMLMKMMFLVANLSQDYVQLMHCWFVAVAAAKNSLAVILRSCFT